MNLVVPFAFRGRAASVSVTVQTNDDPVEWGCDLLDPDLPPNAAQGFPVCIARVDAAAHGYAAVCGWLQVVRSDDACGDFEMDPLALLHDVNSPFAFFGVEPTLFDAPFREERHDLRWTARSFLCAVTGAVMTKEVAPLASFTWGFTVAHGAIAIAGPERLALDCWNEHLPVFRTAHPGWEFVPV